MSKPLFCAIVISLATATAAVAQEQPPVPPPPPVTAPPAPPPSSGQPEQTSPLPAVAPAQPTASAPLDEATIKRRRAEIKNMEGVLASAVRNAAQEIASEMATPETGRFQMSGSLTARGFILDEYGVFFHVEIPGVQPTVISPLALEMLRKGLPRLAQPETASTGTTTSGGTPNPDVQYVERVKNALIRAMIQYSKPLALRPDEWLTVAASDGDEPFMPAILVEQAVMVLRIRGRDINEYLAERLSLEEVTKRVEVRKF